MPKKEKEVVRETSKQKKKPQKIEYPSTVFKDRYRIDILIPLYLDELVRNNKPVYKDKLPDKAVTGVNFYEGIKLAADSLTRLGYKVDIYVHDITQPALSPEMLVKSESLATSDLIIGLVQYGQIHVIADLAKKQHINFISVLSPSDGDVKNNPYFTMLQPTLELHCRKIRQQADKQHGDEQILLLYRTDNYVDSLAYSYMNGGEHIREMAVSPSLKTEQLRQRLDSNKNNIIIIPIVDVDAADVVLQVLHDSFTAYRMEVYGMPSWKSLSTIRKPDAYSNIAVNFSSPFYFDASTPIVQSVSYAYKKDFGGKANEMVFRGYETLFWYAMLLQRYGTVFNLKQNDHSGTLFTEFDVKPQWNRQQDLLYNENEHVYIYWYQGGSYMIVP